MNHEYCCFILILVTCFYFRSTITREKFEELCGDLWEKSLLPVKELLKHSGLKMDDIYAVELIGGATRVPKLQVGSQLSSSLFQTLFFFVIVAFVPVFTFHYHLATFQYDGFLTLHMLLLLSL